jgi:hypothetical protein
LIHRLIFLLLYLAIEIPIAASSTRIRPSPKPHELPVTWQTHQVAPAAFAVAVSILTK